MEPRPGRGAGPDGAAAARAGADVCPPTGRLRPRRPGPGPRPATPSRRGVETASDEGRERAAELGSEAERQEPLRPARPRRPAQLGVAGVGPRGPPTEGALESPRFPPQETHLSAFPRADPAQTPGASARVLLLTLTQSPGELTKPQVPGRPPPPFWSWKSGFLEGVTSFKWLKNIHECKNHLLY